MRIKLLITALFLGSVACGGSKPIDPCETTAAMTTEASFVVVVEPTSGASSKSPFTVRGCSRTFESNVAWELRARDGHVLSSGVAVGGALSHAEAFSFTVDFAVTKSEVGHLSVYEPDESDGEGVPGGRSIIPVVLLPSPLL